MEAVHRLLNNAGDFDEKNDAEHSVRKQMCGFGTGSGLRSPRYVVMNQNGGWQIRNVHRHVTATFSSKAQALCAAIELAEKDGERGHVPEVLVRHEDERFITEWVYGEDLHPDEAARPVATAIPL